MFSRLAFLKRIKAPNGGTYNLRKTTTTTTTTTLSAVLPEQPIGFRFFASQIARRTSCFKPLPKGDYVGSFRKMSSTAGIGMSKIEEELKLVLVNGGFRARIMVGIWLFGSAACVLSMVLYGGVTRLTRFGLSMTDWKFTDSPPQSNEEWLREFDKYKQSPEYKCVNKGMSIEDFKLIYLTECAHRLWGSALGVMFALPFSYFLHKGYIGLHLGVRISLLFALGAGQGLISWCMHKNGWELSSEYTPPGVCPIRLASHLFTASAISYLLFITAVLVVMPEPPAKSVAWVRGAAAKAQRLTVPVSILFAITAAYGAFVTGNDAGHAYNTFPKYILDMKPVIRFSFENTSTVQALDESIEFVDADDEMSDRTKERCAEVVNEHKKQ